MLNNAFFILVITSCITGCSTLTQQHVGYPDNTDLVTQCSKAYSLIATSIKHAGVTDAEAYPIKGYPYLRSSRFLTSFLDKVNDENSISAWMDELILLDQQAKTIEVMNLPIRARNSLITEVKNQTGKNWGINDVINECPSELKKFDIEIPERIAQIKNAADIPDDYSLIKRTIGLYPLTKYIAYNGYQQWKKNNLDTFTNSKSIDGWNGSPVVYKPATSSLLDSLEIANIIQQSRDLDLNIPLLNQTQLKQLAEHFDPVLLIDEISDADKIGHPLWSDANRPVIDTTRPVSFVRLSHTWFEGSVLPQLVYTIWFTERPKTSSWDILGGNLDGIIWRVTIDNNGKALISDSIHPCGCYHLFFPGSGLIKTTEELNNTGLSETIEAPQILPESSISDRLTLRLSGNSHYLQALSNEKKLNRHWQETTYKLIIPDSIPDSALRSMPLTDDEHKSLYNTDGIVEGTERAERWLLWPMGIQSPGAMRQWGRHPTAFVGRRHFDDPYLVDQAFLRK